MDPRPVGDEPAKFKHVHDDIILSVIAIESGQFVTNMPNFNRRCSW